MTISTYFLIVVLNEYVIFSMYEIPKHIIEKMSVPVSDDMSYKLYINKLFNRLLTINFKLFIFLEFLIYLRN